MNMSGKKRFIYRRHSEDTFNDSKIEHEEFLRDDPKGLGFRFMKLDKKKNIYIKINGKLSDDGKKVSLKIREGYDKPLLKSLKVKIADLKEYKELQFVTNYILKDMVKFRKNIEF